MREVPRVVLLKGRSVHIHHSQPCKQMLRSWSNGAQRTSVNIVYAQLSPPIVIKIAIFTPINVAHVFFHVSDVAVAYTVPHAGTIGFSLRDTTSIANNLFILKCVRIRKCCFRADIQTAATVKKT